MYLKHLETLKLPYENKFAFPSSLCGVVDEGLGLLAVTLAAGAVAVIWGVLGVPRFILNLRGHSLSDKRGLGAAGGTQLRARAAGPGCAGARGCQALRE